MTDKKTRQEQLLSIIANNMVHTQEEIVSILDSMGIEATQASLSRDLRELGISKQHIPGEGYVYVARNVSSFSPGRNGSYGVLSLDFAGPLAVIKTRPGFASAVASAIDMSSIAPVVGTIAGDDTVFLALKPSSAEDELINALSRIFPEIKNKQVKQ